MTVARHSLATIEIAGVEQHLVRRWGICLLRTYRASQLLLSRTSDVAADYGKTHAKAETLEVAEP